MAEEVIRGCDTDKVVLDCRHSMQFLTATDVSDTTATEAARRGARSTQARVSPRWEEMASLGSAGLAARNWPLSSIATGRNGLVARRLAHLIP